MEAGRTSATEEPRRAGRVLLAEDDEVFRGFVAAELRRDGHVVIEAEDGDELADHIEVSIYRIGLRPMPDVIISDICMPGPSGLRILEQLRDGERHTPVILMTAFLDDATRAEAVRLGATAVLDKPFDMAALRKAVAEAIGARRGTKT